ncbi:MAG: hypothetical protein WC700_02240 [Gemmatimonadaceae bacterium]|jgi:hypothetical protein
MSRKRNPNEPLPYYNWYVDRWLSDRHVQKFSPAAEGIARRLLDHCWKNGHVVNDLEEMAEISRAKLTMFVREWEQIKMIFRAVENTDGALLTSDFVEDQRTEQDAMRAKRAAAGRLGGLGKQMLASAKQVPDSRVEESRVEGPDLFAAAGVLVPCAPPAPHGAARLIDRAKDMAARVARGEFRREHLS